MARPLLMAIPKSSRTWLRFINAYRGHIYRYEAIDATMRTRVDAARLVRNDPTARPEVALHGTFLSLATHHDLGIAGAREGALFACVNGSVDPIDIRYRLESRDQIVELARRGAFDGGDGFGANAIEGAALKAPVTMDLYMSDPLDQSGRRAFFVDVHDLTHLSYSASDLNGLDLTTYFSIAPEQALADESDRLFAPEQEDFAALLAAQREQSVEGPSDAMAYFNAPAIETGAAPVHMPTAAPAYDPNATNGTPVATAHGTTAPVYGDVAVPEVSDMTDVATPAAAPVAPETPAEPAGARKAWRQPTFDEIMAGYDPDKDVPLTEDDDEGEHETSEPAEQAPADDVSAAFTTDDSTVGGKDDGDGSGHAATRRDANGKIVRKPAKPRRKPVRRPAPIATPVVAPEPAEQAGRDLE